MTEQTETPATEPTTPTVVVSGDKATVVDARGRTFTVQKLTALNLYQLTKALGDASTNVATSDLAALAAAVRSIDGNPVAPPRTERDIEFVIGVLDFDGLAAVGEGPKQLAGTDTVATAKN